MKTPTWDEVRQFLNFDAWTPDRPRSTDHDYFEKTLPTGEVLITKVSRSAGKTMSPGRFKAILSDQLRVNERPVLGCDQAQAAGGEACAKPRAGASFTAPLARAAESRGHPPLRT